MDYFSFPTISKILRTRNIILLLPLAFQNIKLIHKTLAPACFYRHLVDLRGLTRRSLPLLPSENPNDH